ncbi:MAG: class I SAM-dependent methyltransferase [Bacteroidia bacterium]|nr:class I SAM-dependent methyltransferase [Bacteroidia bacterium]
MGIKKIVKRIINKLPYIKRLLKFKTYWEPGHYYSALPNEEYIKANNKRIFSGNTDIYGVNLNDEAQYQFLETLYPYICECPFKNESKVESHRFYNKNGLYGYGDSDLLFAVIRYYKPDRIIEVGSGFSSALMMDTNEKFFNNNIQITFIEPFPERLNLILKDEDRKKYKIVEDIVQNVKVEIFHDLKENDILFIDSSHVLKTSSDLEYLFFEILPNLNKGVIVHFHDIFNNFEYLEDHFLSYKGFGWNEDYFLRAFLMYNNTFEIKYFAHYFDCHNENVLKEKFPKYQLFTSAALWIKKIG